LRGGEERRSHDETTGNAYNRSHEIHRLPSGIIQPPFLREKGKGKEKEKGFRPIKEGKKGELNDLKDC